MFAGKRSSIHKG